MVDITDTYTKQEQEWLVANAREIKSIISGKGRVSLDMKVHIELYNRRLLAMDAKKTA